MMQSMLSTNLAFDSASSHFEISPAYKNQESLKPKCSFNSTMNTKPPKLKKPTTPPQLLSLEEIVGLSTKNCNGLASTASNSMCAYIAACAVVLYDVDSGSKSHLVVSTRKPKPLSCVAITGDGKFVAAGESGKQPSILLWDAEKKTFLCELKGHQFGVASTAFSPDGRHLVSIGFPRDGYLFLWDWRHKILLTKSEAFSSCSAASSVCFTLDSKYILTAGNNHMKFWKTVTPTKSSGSNRPSSWVMHGKSVALGKYKGCSFIAVASPSLSGNTQTPGVHGHERSCFYALTDSGTLFLLKSGLSISKIVKIKVKKCFALSVSDKIVACACSNGTVKLLTVSSLKYAGNLCYREENTSKKRKAEDEFQHLQPLPDAIACQFLTSNKLVVVYNDHSLYIWDIQDVNQPVRCCVLVSHKACILDIANVSCENMHEPSVASVEKGCSGDVSFATCSADGTVRLWDLLSKKNSSENCLVLDIKDTSNNAETRDATELVSTGIFERDSVASEVISPGFSSIAVSSEGRYLAAGDCLGNLHIFNLHTSKYKCIQNAHDGEIISLSFTPSKGEFFSAKISSNVLLASGGTDRMIHLYDVIRDFELIGSKDDHSAKVTSLKLTHGSKLITGSADSSLVVWDVDLTNPEANIMCCHRIASPGTINDISLIHSAEMAVTVGQDKKINAFCISSGKCVRSFKHNDLGEPVKVSIDPSYSYLVCAYASGCICLYDYITGELAAQAVGHSDVITGAIFLSDCRHLASVAGDGCIFLWKLPGHLSSRILQRKLTTSLPLSPKGVDCSKVGRKTESNEINNRWLCSRHVATKSSSWETNHNLNAQEKNSQDASEFVFSISRLPKWAQSKVIGSCSIEADHNSSSFKDDSIQPQPFLDVQVPGYSFFHDSQSPCDQESEKTDGCMSRTLSDSDVGRSLGSEALTRNSSSFNNKWLTIHTVCFDLQSSPEFREMNTRSLKYLRGNVYRAEEDNARDTNNKNKRIKLSGAEHDFNFCRKEETQSSSFSQQSILDDFGALLAKGNQVTDLKLSSQLGDLCNMASTKLEPDLNQDLVPINVNSLDKNSHAERRKPSPRESCSPGDVNVTGLLQSKGLIGNTHVELRDSEEEDARKQERAANSMTSEFLTSNSAFGSSGRSINSDISKLKFQDDISDRTNQQERVAACKEALCSLETSADAALHSFLKFSALDSEHDTSTRHSNTQFWSEASLALSRIQEKIKQVARLAKPANHGP